MRGGVCVARASGGASRRWGGWPAAACRAVRWPSGGTGHWGRRVSVSHCISMRAVSRGDSRVDDTGCGAAREAGAGGAGTSTRARARAAAWRRAAATEGRGCMVARTRGSSEHLEEAGGPARRRGGRVRSSVTLRRPFPGCSLPSLCSDRAARSHSKAHQRRGAAGGEESWSRVSAGEQRLFPPQQVINASNGLRVAHRRRIGEPPACCAATRAVAAAAPCWTTRRLLGPLLRR